MAWSTQQLADLAGMTVKTVRHYHRVGVLDEPERLPNGYKQYGTSHLVRLLQIKRMSDLGVSLAQIRDLSATDDPRAAVEVLDAELEAAITRLQRTRAELALILKHRVPLDTPARLEAAAEDLPERYQGMLAVYSRVLDDAALEGVSELLTESDDASESFDALIDESDEDAVDAVARLLATSMVGHRRRFPWASEPRSAMRGRGNLGQEALVSAAAEVFTRGQLRALARAHEIAQAVLAADQED